MNGLEILKSNLNMNLTVVDYDPSKGQALQGDVIIAGLPAGKFNLDRSQEIKAKQGRLILAEGEVTGHHHSIGVMDRPDTSAAINAMLAEANAGAEKEMTKAKGLTSGLEAKTVGSARLYKDDAILDQMMKDGVLVRKDLAIGILEVSGAPMVLEHQEHNAFRIPEGIYYIGRQIESVGAETRVVSD